ncbi:MAG: outer membrane lipoprotein chaperone LolA [Limnohabitans sp.]|nr:MAG: outer membrane lipoprotein chaperone LolA [Limnohabitans sp.]
MTVAALMGLPARAQSDGLQLLGQFLQSVRSGRAQFTQVVTSVPKAGQPPRQRTSSGTLEFQRPGRFRFSYKKPFEQTLLADGQTLWLHDPDLQQVTARAQAQVLGSTPLALIISATDLAGLQKDFQLQPEAARDGLQWVRATPKRAEGQVQQVLAGFRASDRGAELVVLEVLDTLGQRSVLTFSQFEINPAIKADAFQFHVPTGTDVIRP